MRLLNQTKKTMQRTVVTNHDGDPIGWIDLAKVSETHKSDTRWDGNNMIAVHGGQCRMETLYLTRGGKWVIYDSASGPHGTSWQGSVDTCYAISEAEAADWLLVNGETDHALVDDMEIA